MGNMGHVSEQVVSSDGRGNYGIEVDASTARSKSKRVDRTSSADSSSPMFGRKGDRSLFDKLRASLEPRGPSRSRRMVGDMAGDSGDVEALTLMNNRRTTTASTNKF